MFESYSSLESYDPEVAAAIANEERRQEEHIELIASENYVSDAVLDCLRRDAERIYVGKSRGNHSRSQEHAVQRREGRGVVKTAGNFSPVVGRFLDAETAGREIDFKIDFLVEKLHSVIEVFN